VTLPLGNGRPHRAVVIIDLNHLGRDENAGEEDADLGWLAVWHDPDLAPAARFPEHDPSRARTLPAQQDMLQVVQRREGPSVDAQQGVTHDQSRVGGG
jgi:hypothetical protein